MKQPNISIIVPIYNVEKYLPKCIDSILKQTFTEFELLLIDDGSKDLSGRICDEYAKKDTRIKVFHKSNGGVSSARNIGLLHAKGEWIYFADADDELELDGLEILFSAVKDNNIDFVMGGYTKYDENEKMLFTTPKRQDKILSAQTCISYLFKPKGYEYHGYLWNKLFKKSIVSDLKFNEDIYFNEDRLFIVQYLCKCVGHCYYTARPIYNYYIRETSAMASFYNSFNPKFVTDLDAYLIIYNELAKHGQKENIQLVQLGICSSCYNIKDMMKRFGVKNQSLDNKISKVLHEYVSNCNLIRFRTIYMYKKIRKYIRTYIYGKI